MCPCLLEPFADSCIHHWTSIGRQQALQSRLELNQGQPVSSLWQAVTELPAEKQWRPRYKNSFIQALQTQLTETSSSRFYSVCWYDVICQPNSMFLQVCGERNYTSPKCHLPDRKNALTVSSWELHPHVFLTDASFWIWELYSSQQILCTPGDLLVLFCLK